MYTVESINAVRSADIVSVIGRFVKLDRNKKACCPFHNEKTASFSVSPVKKIFKCFGCGKGGDVVEFVKEHQRCDFVKAIEIIADFENITLETERNFDREAYVRAKEEVKTVKEVVSIAHKKYIEQLYLPQNTEALNYWSKRGYGHEILCYWGFGYAPLNMGFLTRDFASNGLLPVAVKAGLVVEKENSSRDFFINRVIIPIVDENGELVSFAGRITERESKYKKYINGPVTPLYNKSRTIFGLYQAIPSIIELGYAILTEGYTDVISMHAAGASNTIASCGTAFTEDMARLLKRYTDRVVLMRDSDKAGQKAEDNDLVLLLKFNFKVEIMTLKEGKDPDEYARDFITEFKDEDFLPEVVLQPVQTVNFEYNDRLPVDDEQY